MRRLAPRERPEPAELTTDFYYIEYHSGDQVQ